MYPIPIPSRARPNGRKARLTVGMDLPEPLMALLSQGLLGIMVLAIVEKLIPIIPSYVLYVFLGMVIPGRWLDLGQAIAVSAAARRRIHQADSTSPPFTGYRL